MSSRFMISILETIALCAISLAAFIGNFSLFIIVYKDKNLQTVTNLYILNLAVADILVSILSIPFTIVTIIEDRWAFGDTACVALGFFTILSFISSVMSLGMIAINRYFYIVRWNSYHRTFSRRNALLYAAAVWVVATSLAFPPLIGWAEYRFIPGKSYCFVYWPSNVHFMYFMITVCFFGPLSAITFSYYNLLKFTRDMKRQLAKSINITPPPPVRCFNPPTATEHGNNALHIDTNIEKQPKINVLKKNKSGFISKSLESSVTPEETKITNTFLYVVTLFVICWAPFAVTMFFDVYYPTPIPRALDMASLILGYLNSMCNPVLYGLRNSAFKQGFLSLYSRFLPARFRPTDVT
ncbi:melatonin receptor type 1B-B-like [Stylophora pistillata]|uniref:melatonin receptor type 1B-B-like n=1 Tax=Stylophora pistillata TaxID=50429 RepID=UPI000C049487|nr:melatonin receptor type 1B-B-like [Stylophora pistillata]